MNDENRSVPTAPGRRMLPAAGGSPQWLRVARSISGALAVVSAWLWVLILVGVPVAAWAVHRYATLDQSIAQYATYALTWVPFSVAVILASTQLTIHVANGMTRRSFVKAALAVVLTAAVLYGLLLAVVLLVEGAVYGSLGLPHGGAGTNAANGVVVGLWERGFLASWASYGVVTLAGLVSGLAVGAGYYRLGGLRGSLLLPVGLLPVLAAQLIIDIDSPESLGTRLGLDLTWYLPAVVLLVLAGLVLFAALVRRTPVGGVGD